MENFDWMTIAAAVAGALVGAFGMWYKAWREKVKNDGVDDKYDRIVEAVDKLAEALQPKAE